MDQLGGYNPYALDRSGITAPPVSLFAALRKIGPGIILAGSIVGTGELLLTTSLGAEYGFAFLWLILFSCVVKVFVQIELGRYALSSGEPTLAALDNLPGPRFGAHWLVWWWFIMLMFTVSQLGAMCGGVGQALHLAFPGVTEALAGGIETLSPALAEEVRLRPEHPWAIVTAVVAVLLLLRGGYKRIEHITTFLVVSVTMTTVACVALLPSMGFTIGWEDLQEGFSLKVLTLSPMAIAAAFSAFGITGVGASELYAYPYWCLEKGYARFAGPRDDSPEWAARANGWMRVMYLDAWVSMVVFTVATVAFYTLGAVVLHRQHLVPEKTQMIATLSEMYVPAFGKWTKIAFLIGAWAVLFKTLYVASASNSRLTADFLGLARFVHYKNAEQRSKWITRCCVFYPLLGLAWYLWMRDPRAMTILGGFVQAATLPIIAGAAIFLRYRRLDQRLAPSRWSDLFLWLAFLSITAVACYAIPQQVMPFFTKAP
ncbi:MAG TPA: Nramp family divalent metal transporter [Pirellulales bacterium]|jgi:Mn2+/Fe2+ NRAMP family transporter